jgi:hypothetical protein
MLPGLDLLETLVSVYPKMEAAYSSETVVSMYETTRYHNPKYHSIHPQVGNQLAKVA